MTSILLYYDIRFIVLSNFTCVVIVVLRRYPRKSSQTRHRRKLRVFKIDKRRKL